MKIFSLLRISTDFREYGHAYCCFAIFPFTSFYMNKVVNKNLNT